MLGCTGFWHRDNQERLDGVRNASSRCAYPSVAGNDLAIWNVTGRQDRYLRQLDEPKRLEIDYRREA